MRPIERRVSFKLAQEEFSNLINKQHGHRDGPVDTREGKAIIMSSSGTYLIDLQGIPLVLAHSVPLPQSFSIGRMSHSSLIILFSHTQYQKRNSNLECNGAW